MPAPWLAAGRDAGLAAVTRSARAAPFIDLDRVREAGGFLAGLRPNLRRQLRRAVRRHAESGPLRIDRAADCAEAERFLAALAELHQGRWTARSRPGAFADPRLLRFHRALIARALPRGEVDLLRISAGPRAIGYLYNFRFAGRVYAYQGGFDYSGADAQLKPGLICHLLAIEDALGAGAERYDFLAGDDRYKRELANAETMLFWAELAPPASLRRLLAVGWQGLHALSARARGRLRRTHP